jgi:hypothetical protein
MSWKLPPPRPDLLSTRRLLGRAALAAGALLVAAAFVSAIGGTGRADARPQPAAVSVSVTLPADRPVSAGFLLVTLPWGDGPGQVGLQRPSEGLSRGPEALAVAPDGLIALLDSVNHRVMLLSSAGEPLLTIPSNLPEPRFLAVDSRHIYALDCDSAHRVLGWDRTGALVLDRSVALPTDQPVTALMARDGGLFVETGHERVYPLASLGPGKRTAAVTGDPGATNSVAAATPSVDGATPSTDTELPALDPATPSLTGRPEGGPDQHLVQARLTRGDRPRIHLLAPDGKPAPGAPQEISLDIPETVEHLVSVDEAPRPSGTDLLVGARLLGRSDDRAGNEARLLVARIPADGSTRPAQALLLKESRFAYVGQPYVAAPDGRIYQPLPTPEGYSILVHTIPEGGTK